MCNISSQNFVECGERIRKQGFENLGLRFNFLTLLWPLCFCSNWETLMEVSRKFGFLARHKFKPLDILFLIDRHGWVFVNEKKINKALIWRLCFSFFFLFILGTFFFSGQEWKSLCTKEKWCPQLKYVFTDVFWSAQCIPSAFRDSGSCWSWGRPVETKFVHLLAFLWTLSLF